MKQIFISLILLSMISAGCRDSHPGHHQAGMDAGHSSPDYGMVLIETGKKYSISGEYSFELNFDKNPSLGMIVVKIELFDSSGKKSTALKITGDSGMPAMKGSHDSGEVEFKLNKKGVYLLPFNIVMPGKWEVKLKFFRDKKEIHTARIEFNV